jgi:hypothetical protein
MTKTVKCSSCEHGHAIGSTCPMPTRGTGSGMSVPCGCDVGAASVITVQRSRLVPAGNGGYRAAWKWTYTYAIDGGAPCQYGPGLASLRNTLRSHYRGATIVEQF